MDRRSSLVFDVPMREGHEVPDRLQDVFSNPSCSCWVVTCDVFPDFHDVSSGFGVEIESARGGHRGRRFSRSSSRCRNVSKNLSPSTGFTPPLLRSSYRLSSGFRREATWSREPASGSSTISSGGRPP